MKNPPAKRRLGRPWWWVAVICLLALAIKTTRVASQPRYQGKTVAEWFDEYHPIAKCGLAGEELPDCIRQEQQKQITVFQALGTNGVWFLWEEYQRKDSPFTVWFAQETGYHLGSPTGGIPPGEDRKYRALSLLRLVGPGAEPLIPVLLPQLLSADKEEVARAADLLGRIQRQPESVVPALVQSWLILRHQKATDRLGHLSALGHHGPEAASALSVLRAKLADTSLHPWEIAALNHAILKINGPGPELAYFTNQLKPGNYSVSEGAVLALAALGTNARPATPVLLELYQSLRHPDELKRVRYTLHKINPEAGFVIP